jgi:hypothetical protein
MSKWKGFEKFIASIFTTARTPFSGSNSGVTSSDSLHNRLYVECKFHQDQAVINLMKSTKVLAQKENKIPLLALADPEDESKSKYVMFDIKDLFSVVREIDLNELDKKIPENTTIYKLMETSSSENRSLFELRDEIDIQIKQIIRNKIISNDDLNGVKSLSILAYMIENIINYQKDDGEQEGPNEDPIVDDQDEEEDNGE